MAAGPQSVAWPWYGLHGRLTPALLNIPVDCVTLEHHQSIVFTGRLSSSQHRARNLTKR